MKQDEAEHAEDSIELLFQAHFGERYGAGLPVTAAKAGSALRLREVWSRHRPPVGFDEFAEDAFRSLQHAYNRKYGQWDRVNDLRALYPDSWYARVLPVTAALGPAATVLGVGVNDGREVRQLFADRDLAIDLVDISSEAIRQVATRLGDYRRVRSFVGSFEDWEPAATGYDLFFALRTLNSTSVDHRACVRKSVALVRPGGTLIYSVSNGYVHMRHGAPRPVHGMFSAETGTIDAARPRQLVAEIVDLLRAEGAAVADVAEEPTEIYVVARTHDQPGGGPDGGR